MRPLGFGQTAIESLRGLPLGNLFFRKSVGTQPIKDPEVGTVRIFSGMDPTGAQRIGTDPVEIYLGRYNGDGWESLFRVRQRPGSNLADLYIGGFLQAGGGVYTPPGSAWKNSSGNVGTANTLAPLKSGKVLLGSVGGTIESSADGGITFGVNPSENHTSAIYGFCETDAGVYAFGSLGEISLSTDNGVSWGDLISSGFASTVAIRDMAWNPDDDIAIAVASTVGGSAPFMRLTADGGSSWSTPTGAPNHSMLAIEYVGNKTFVAMGTNLSSKLAIYRSTDNGSTFTEISQDLSAYSNLMGMALGNNVLIIAAVNWGEAKEVILYSTDFGITWTEATTPTITSAAWPAFANGLFFAGSYRSSDNGRTFVACEDDSIFTIVVYCEAFQRLCGIRGTTYTVQYSDWHDVSQPRQTEGEVTFAYEGGSGFYTNAITSQDVEYVKTGSLVTIQGRVTMTYSGSLTNMGTKGTWFILSGLPFVPRDHGTGTITEKIGHWQGYDSYATPKWRSGDITYRGSNGNAYFITTVDDGAWISGDMECLITLQYHTDE